jgi:hypothetical protein
VSLHDLFGLIFFQDPDLQVSPIFCTLSIQVRYICEYPSSHPFEKFRNASGVLGDAEKGFSAISSQARFILLNMSSPPDIMPKESLDQRVQSALSERHQEIAASCHQDLCSLRIFENSFQVG